MGSIAAFLDVVTETSNERPGKALYAVNLYVTEIVGPSSLPNFGSGIIPERVPGKLKSE